MSRILVLEQRPKWYPELQRQLAGASVRIQPRASASEVRTELAALPPGESRIAVLVDLNVGASGVLTLAASVRQRPDVRVAVVGQTESLPLESVLRELGVDSFLLMPVSGEQVAIECARLIGLVPAQAGSTAESAGS
ncbi:hypothetical protein GC176_22790 [bacterium]|nr:hypothetical protein [bacterium]